MLPTFHMNNFKPWVPRTSHKKPFLPQKSPNPCSPRSQNLPRPKPHNSHPSTLPLPMHHLPARPPAEVCVHQPCTPLSSQFQPRQISVLQSNADLEDPKHGAAPSQDLGPPISDSDPIPRGGLQDDTNIPIEPPDFREDFAEDSPSSPSASSSDDSLEELFRLPDAQGDIPIDPVILADHEPWEDSGLQKSVQQADSVINSETTCPYPDPPPVLHGPPDRIRVPSEGAGGQNGDTQTSDQPHINNHQQLHPSEHDTYPDALYYDGARGKPHVSGQSKISKRKTQKSDGQARKRRRIPSTLPQRKHSFTTLRSHFVSLPLDERLQFLSWLFEGALHCMSDSLPTAYEDRPTREASRSNPPHEIEQNRPEGSSRKGMPWSSEEVDLLLKLRKNESRPWSEVTRLFSEQYPGRSSGAIQVFWSINLNKKADYR